MLHTKGFKNRLLLSLTYILDNSSMARTFSTALRSSTTRASTSTSATTLTPTSTRATTSFSFCFLLLLLLVVCTDVTCVTKQRICGWSNAVLFSRSLVVRIRERVYLFISLSIIFYVRSGYTPLPFKFWSFLVVAVVGFWTSIVILSRKHNFNVKLYKCNFWFIKKLQ